MNTDKKTPDENGSLIRPLIPNDLSRLLEINIAAEPHVGHIDMRQLTWFADHAHYFRVVEKTNDVAGFLIALEPGTEYTSLNYRWFIQRFDCFAYVDRIAVAEEFRNAGIGAMLYGSLCTHYQGNVPRVTCEVNLEPPNPGSMRFHQRQGFVEIGQQTTDNGSKRVSLMEKKL